MHLSFDVMVGTGFALAALALWFALSSWRSRAATPNRWFLAAVAVSGVVSIVSFESGWVVTEVGRQPWAVVGLLLTRDAVQTSGNLWPLFAGAVVIYVGVAVGASYALRSLRHRWALGEITASPYGPEDEPAVGVVALAAVVFVVPSLAWLLLLTDRGRLGEPTP